jgi:putative endonuclease
MDNKRTFGNAGETLVCDYLEKKGFKVVARNYQTRQGEVDVIAVRDEILAFIEVKTRRNSYFPISNVVTYGKQKKITKTAKYFIVKNKIIDKACRFDVATVVWDNNGNPAIDYIENAFYAV